MEQVKFDKKTTKFDNRIESIKPHAVGLSERKGDGMRFENKITKYKGK